jgi:hypothetical protein
LCCVSKPYCIVAIVQESLGLTFNSLGINCIASQTRHDDIQALAEVKKSVEECRRMERLAETDEHNDFRGSHEKTPLMLN